MAAGFVCDRCGAAIFEGENTKLTIRLEGSDEGIVAEEIDLCPKCAEAVSGIVEHRIIIAATNQAAFERIKVADHAPDASA